MEKHSEGEWEKNGKRNTYEMRQQIQMWKYNRAEQKRPMLNNFFMLK